MSERAIFQIVIINHINDNGVTLKEVIEMKPNEAETFSVRETLEKQIQQLSERSAQLTDIGEILLITREIRNLAILLSGVNKRELFKHGYESD